MLVFLVPNIKLVYLIFFLLNVKIYSHQYHFPCWGLVVVVHCSTLLGFTSPANNDVEINIFSIPCWDLVDLEHYPFLLGILAMADHNAG